MHDAKAVINIKVNIMDNEVKRKQMKVGGSITSRMLRMR